MYLIIHNKLWIFVEDRVLSFSQWHEWFQHPLRVCFCWSAILQSVSFTYNCTNVDCIPVMKEVLVRRKSFIFVTLLHRNTYGILQFLLCENYSFDT